METIRLKTLYSLFRALPRCSLVVTSGDVLIVDLHGEVLGEVDFTNKQALVYREYSYSDKAYRRIKKVSIPVKLIKQPVMEKATQILYER